VLVQSTNGQSRPATLVIAYLMYTNKMSLANALAFVKLKRKSALPNTNFMRQLDEFEKVMQVGKYSKAPVVSQVVHDMAIKPHRKPYSIFKGIHKTSGIVDISENLSKKIGLSLDKQKSNTSIIPVLNSRADLN
jgi:hypothetical protein